MPCEDPFSVPFVLAFDHLLNGPVHEFSNCSNKIGGDVASIAKIVEAVFSAQKNFLVAAAASQKPSDTDLAKVLEPIGKKIQEVIDFRETRRASPLFNHISAVSESIPALTWVAISPTPAPYVKEMGDAAVFYTNRVLKEYKEKDRTHVEWVQYLNTIYKDLFSYIKEHHTTGVSWNPRGTNILNNMNVSPTASSAGGVPLPPPGAPPPPPVIEMSKLQTDDQRSKLFEEINQGLDITSSLKRVPDTMKTHKNPNLREGPKPFMKNTETGYSKTASTFQAVQKEPRVALEGKKWFVEYQKNNSNLVMSECKMDHSIYVYKCENTVIQVKGKVKSITFDSCKKTSIVYDSLVSAFEFVNCQSCQMQVLGQVPTISIEKTDGCQVYLSRDSLNVEIVTAKSSEMNVLLPSGTAGEFTECPVPEQFKTTVQGEKLVTVCTEKSDDTHRIPHFLVNIFRTQRLPGTRRNT